MRVFNFKKLEVIIALVFALGVLIFSYFSLKLIEPSKNRQILYKTHQEVERIVKELRYSNLKIHKTRMFSSSERINE